MQTTRLIPLDATGLLPGKRDEHRDFHNGYMIVADRFILIPAPKKLGTRNG